MVSPADRLQAVLDAPVCINDERSSHGYLCLSLRLPQQQQVQRYSRDEEVPLVEAEQEAVSCPSSSLS
jgi:hypothetical protein